MTEWSRRLRTQLGANRGSPKHCVVETCFLRVVAVSTATPEVLQKPPTRPPVEKNVVPEVGFEPTRTSAQLILSQPPWTSRASRRKTGMDGLPCIQSMGACVE